MKKAILISALVISVLGLGGFFVYKNIFAPEEKEVYIYKGVGAPTLDYSFSQVSILPGEPEDYRPAMFDLDWAAESGINTLAFNVGL